jgi:hypothetical protein
MLSTQKKPITRAMRTSEFREKVEREWKAYYLEFIEPYMDKPGFNWCNLSSNPNIDPQYIFDNPQLPWSLDRVICRLDIPIDMVTNLYFGRY